MKRTLYCLHTTLCLGLNLVIKRIRPLADGMPRRYKYLLLTIIILNEIRGLYVVYTLGDTLWLTF